MKKSLILSLLALAASAAPAPAAVQSAVTDLVLGFRATGGQGQSINLEVDLGSISQYYNQPAGTHFTVASLSPVDLNTIYGSSWTTRSDLFWGIVGSAGRLAVGPNGQPVATLWGSYPETTAGTQSTAPWTPSSRNGQMAASAIIEPLYGYAPGSLGGTTATANSSSAASINANLSGSYSAQDLSQPGESFGFFNPAIDASARVLFGGYAVTDLYELRPGGSSATYVGSFGLSASGTLVFSNAPSYFTQAQGNSTFTTQPAALTIASGSTATLVAIATGTPAPSYQWYVNGVAIPSATSSRLVINSATSANAGSYVCVATNSSGSNSSSAAVLTVTSTSNPGRLVNLSVNAAIDSSGLTMGFVTGGAGTTGTQSLLIRAGGPALIPYGVPNTLADPQLTVLNGSTSIATNAGWGTPASNQTVVNLAQANTGAGLIYSNAASLDSATVLALAPNPGYTVQVVSKSSASGRTLAEVYDNTPANTYTATTPRLVNVSCRIQLAVNGSLTDGFVIGGSTSKTVLIRAIGPGLLAYGVTGAMADPQLVVYKDSTAIASNSAWGGDPQLTAAMTAVSAQPNPPQAKDCAVLLTLAPGSYTAVASSASGAAGNVLVDIYEVP